MKRCSNNTVAFILVVSFLFSCGKAYEGQRSSASEKYARYFSVIGMGEPQSKLIIVPTRGCGPCIKSAMDFLRDSAKSSNFTVVVSGPSRKSCLLLMKKFNLKRNDVVIDAKFQAKDYGILTIYPTIVSYENGKWSSIDITPENYHNAFNGV